ncbi:MAG TPA: fasciclin domain-containing protein, partial [Rhodothermales bacterium]|nr:fasciclin domain-containing protein [Rhodothermales bacterium]
MRPGLLRLLLPALVLAASLLGCDGEADPGTDLVNGPLATVLGAHEDFETLAEGLTATDLMGTLGEAGPFTVFAPTDDAFLYLGIAA